MNDRQDAVYRLAHALHEGLGAIYDHPDPLRKPCRTCIERAEAIFAWMGKEGLLREEHGVTHAY